MTLTLGRLMRRAPAAPRPATTAARTIRSTCGPASSHEAPCDAGGGGLGGRRALAGGALDERRQSASASSNGVAAA